MISELLKKVRDEGYSGLLILGFPTLGKSTLVRELNIGLYGEAYKGLAIDFDLKKGSKLPMDDNIRSSISTLMMSWFDAGIKVICSFQPWVDITMIDREKVYVMGYLPESSRMVALRVKQRDGVCDFFGSVIVDGDKWIAGWKKQFEIDHVPFEILKPYQYLSNWY